MKKVYQAVFEEGLGDCFRACVAAIFEFPIEHMPNFWEQTQDPEEFWKLTDRWIREHLHCRCINFYFSKKDRHLVDDVLCIASGRSPRNNDEDHAVVWKNGLIHDPHPSNEGLAKAPGTFTLFIPLNPLNLLSRKP